MPQLATGSTQSEGPGKVWMYTWRAPRVGCRQVRRSASRIWRFAPSRTRPFFVVVVVVVVENYAVVIPLVASSLCRPLEEVAEFVQIEKKQFIVVLTGLRSLANQRVQLFWPYIKLSFFKY